jgi:hypothetical protein
MRRKEKKMNKLDVARILLDYLKECGHEELLTRKHYTCSKTFIRQGETKRGRKFDDLIYLSDPFILSLAKDYDFGKLINNRRNYGRETIKALAFRKNESSMLVCAILTTPKIYKVCKKMFIKGLRDAALVTARIMFDEEKMLG